jgi:hypothetical protein
MKLVRMLAGGPLNSGGAWTPLNLSPSLWLKADSITGLADGEKVSQWNDLSGNNNHCVQTTESVKPLYSAVGITGKPEVVFSYKDLTINPFPFLTIPNGVSVSTDDCTIIFIGRPVNKVGVSAYCVPVALAGIKIGYSPTSTCAVLGSLRVGTPLVYHQTAMIALTSTPATGKLRYNSVSDNIPAIAHATATGGRIGTDTGGAYAFYGTLNEVLVYNKALSDVEMGNVYTYARNKYGFANPPTNQIIFDGDSLTTGYACLNHSHYPGQIWGLLGGDWKIYGVSVAGQTLVGMQGDASTEIDSLYSAELSKNVLVCWGGLLDVYGGADVATTLTRLQTYCAARQAAGWQVVVLTCLPSLYISEENRAALNTGIRNNYATWADAIADIAADSRIGDAGDNDNALYYNNSDGNKTHMTATGFAIVAGIVKAAIDALA